jgi:periplasmic protein TonB
VSVSTHSAEAPKRLLGTGSLRWIAAIVIAMIIHGGAIWTIVREKSEDSPPNEPPPAVMIDLAPVTPAAGTPTPDVATGPQMNEAEPPPTAATEAAKPVDAMSPSPTPDTQESVVPQAKPEPPPPDPPAAEPPKAEAEPTKPPPEHEPQPQSVAPQPKIETPPPPIPEPEAPPPAADSTPDALPPPPVPAEPPVTDAVLQPHDMARPVEPPALRFEPAPLKAKTLRPSRPLPGHAQKAGEARPSAAKVKATKPEPVRERTTSEEKVHDNRRASAPSAAPPAAARPQSAVAPASSAGQSTAALASWKGQLVAHINRFKRFPDRAVMGGTSTVAFTIDPSGRVLSARLARSSGDPVLDQEAVELLHRASPVPAPPPDLGRGTITLSVPIRFNR